MLRPLVVEREGSGSEDGVNLIREYFEKSCGTSYEICTKSCKFVFLDKSCYLLLRKRLKSRTRVGFQDKIFQHKG